MPSISQVTEVWILCKAVDEVDGVDVVGLNPVVGIVRPLDYSHTSNSKVIHTPAQSRVVEVVPLKG